MFFRPCTEEEISSVILGLTKQGSIEDTMVSFLKMSIPYISPMICSLFNFCFESGIYPERLKLSNITPIYKKGPQNVIDNYRPVSVQSNIGKIFDSIIYYRLQSFFFSQNILSEAQYGFRKGKSTELASLCLMSKLMPAISEKKFAICIFLDYSACFDTLCRNSQYTF